MFPSFCNTDGRDSGNYMRAKEIGDEPILPAMPGPWGKACEALRHAKGLTKDVIAKRAKMTPTTYGRIERGQHTQTRKLQHIADVFGVSIEDVLLQNGGLSRASGSSTPFGPHGSPHPAVSATTHAELLELRAQVRQLSQQIAEIAATRATKHGPARKRAATARARKSLRAKNDRRAG